MIGKPHRCAAAILCLVLLFWGGLLLHVLTTAAAAGEGITITLEADEAGALAGRSLDLYRIAPRPERGREQERLARLAGLSASELAARYGKPQASGESDAHGRVLLPALPDGTYYVRERDGKRSRTMVPFFLYVPDRPAHHQVYPKSSSERPGRPLGRVELEKTDPAGKPLAGALFELWRREGTREERVPLRDGRYDPAGRRDLRLASDRDGRIVLAGLPSGEYVFREVAAPPGYKLAGEDLPFQAMRGRTARLQAVNRPEDGLGRRAFRKVSAADGRPLAGATFKVMVRRDGVLVPVRRDGSDYVLRSGADGGFAAERLPYGSYYLVESRAPEGHQLLATPLPFEVGPAEVRQVLLVENRPKPPLPPGGPPPPPGAPPVSPRPELPKTGDLLFFFLSAGGGLLALSGRALLRRTSID